MEEPPLLNELTNLPIVRTIGTDDVLAAALLWELWQRGVNRNLYKDTWLTRKWAQLVKHQDPAAFRDLHCADGLVLISEWDSEYARALSRNLSEGFSARCKVAGDSRPSCALVHLPAWAGRDAAGHRQIERQCAAQGRQRQIKRPARAARGRAAGARRGAQPVRLSAAARRRDRAAR